MTTFIVKRSSLAWKFQTERSNEPNVRNPNVWEWEFILFGFQTLGFRHSTVLFASDKNNLLSAFLLLGWISFGLDDVELAWHARQPEQVIAMEPDGKKIKILIFLQIL